MKKNQKAAPVRIYREAREPDPFKPVAPAVRPEAPAATPLPRRYYRRSPFYLKIEGLTGPRPKYDAYGRLVRDEDVAALPVRSIPRT